MFFLRIGLICLGIFLFIRPVEAMEVKPPILELSVAPTASTSTVFLLKNTEVIPRTYAFTIQGFVAGGDGGEQRFLPVSETAGLPSWLFVTKPQVTLQPGEEVPVPIFFRPPLEAKAGGYQAVIFATVVESEAAGGVTLGSRVGVLVFARVEGEVTRKMNAVSFSQVSSRLVHRPSLKAEVIMENQGSIHEIPQGFLSITDMFGRVVGRVSLQEEGRPARILPNSIRKFSLTWGQESEVTGFWEGLQQEWSSFSVGIYKARLELEEPVQATTSILTFFVLPWRTFLIFLIGLGGTVILKKVWSRSR